MGHKLRGNLSVLSFRLTGIGNGLRPKTVDVAIGAFPTRDDR